MNDVGKPLDQCLACISRSNEIEFLRSQVKDLQDKLLSLAEPMAMARVQAATARLQQAPVPAQERRPIPPPVHPREIARQRPDVPTEGELNRYVTTVTNERDALAKELEERQVARETAPEPVAPSPQRAEIEASFEKPEE